MFVIIVSLFVSLCLSVFPFSSWGIWLNPLWPLLILLAWNYFLPNSVNIGVAFIVGLLVDALGGGILGLHALSFVVSVLLMNIFRVRIKMFHVLQQSLCIAVLLFINLSIVLLGTLFLDDATVYAASYFTVFTSAIAWPFILWLFSKSCSSLASDKKLGWR
jgi:rod shape-determining protein MreD